MSARGRRFAHILIGASSLAAAASAAAQPAFDLQTVESPGRTALAEIVDLDGDGRGDLLSASFSGLPPRERRELQVRYQRADGRVPEAPDWRAPLPEGAAAYDLAALEPGVDGAGAVSALLLLRRDRISVLSFAGRVPARRDLPLPGPAVSVVADERGLDRLRIARPDLGEPLRLVVPGFGECFVLSAAGEPFGRPAVGARANYFIPPQPGPLFAESEMEMYFDVPRLDSGDVDGDGRVDLVASTRHEIRVFLQREGGRFATDADRVHPLGALSEEDHVARAGAVRIGTADFDADGRADLLVSRSSGGFLDSSSETTLYLNRDGRWDLAAPDQVFRSRGLATNHLIDVDGDGRVELVEARIPLGVLPLIEVLVTRGLDAELAIYRGRDERGGEPFESRPWFRRSIEVAFSFERFRPRGFVPTIDADLNGDGHRDLLASGDGNAIEVYLGAPDRGFPRRNAEQEVDTGGRIRFGDFDRDGFTDFALYDPRRPHTPIRLGINRRTLPGSRALDVASPPPRDRTDGG